ncbi:MAG: UDP-N-acetylmuramoyl-tripeptide--D-alanyl-D-alanine ligase [Actinomycetota bacterium]
MTMAIDLGWALADIAGRLAGSLVGDSSARVASVGIDSRDVAPDSLFVAIKGENFDGHEYAGDALNAGASAVVVERGRCQDVETRIEVDDTLDALRDLGIMRRDELDMPVIAITGSTGKTSTKDLLSAGIDRSWASPRSFNNEVGVPLTILSTPDDASALIVEVGSRGAGHIAWLAPVVRPHVAIVTNLGVVHLETFGSEEGLADAKFELIEALESGGTAIVPSAEHRLQRPIVQRQITFGRPPADVEVEAAGTAPDGSSTYRIRALGDTYEGTLAMAGIHHAVNAAAAIAAAVALGLDIATFAERMQTTSGSDWRMDVHPGRYTVVNDAYNANPQSVASALETVAAMPGRLIAVLGPMAELGPVCEREHARMGELAVQLGFESLVVIGPDHGYALGAGGIVVHAADISEAHDTLTAILEPGDTVLIKASRSAGLERLAVELIQDARR